MSPAIKQCEQFKNHGLKLYQVICIYVNVPTTTWDLIHIDLPVCNTLLNGCTEYITPFFHTLTRLRTEPTLSLKYKTWYNLITHIVFYQKRKNANADQLKTNCLLPQWLRRPFLIHQWPLILGNISVAIIRLYIAVKTNVKNREKT